MWLRRDTDYKRSPFLRRSGSKTPRSIPLGRIEGVRVRWRRFDSSFLLLWGGGPAAVFEAFFPSTLRMLRPPVGREDRLAICDGRKGRTCGCVVRGSRVVLDCAVEVFPSCDGFLGYVFCRFLDIGKVSKAIRRAGFGMGAYPGGIEGLMRVWIVLPVDSVPKPVVL